MTLTSANLRRIMPNGKAQSLQISGAPQAVCLSPRLLLGGRGAITLAFRAAWVSLVAQADAEVVACVQHPSDGMSGNP